MALRSLLPLLLAATTFAWPQDGSQPQCSGTVVTNKQTNAPHGLYQISHKDLHSGGIALNNSEYMFAPNPGKDTCAYVIDTGILPDHSEYATRVLALWDCLDAGNSSDATDGSKNYGCRLVLKDDDGKWPSNFDGNGHGTHTAGTVLGKTYGVAKEAKLIGIKVLDANGAGSTDDIKSAVRLAAKDAKERSQPGRDCTKGTACNLSLGSGLVGTVLSFLGGAGVKVVNEAADAGLFCAVAAGNSDALAEFSNPANEIKACTVGALNPQNYKACFSNYGEVVDVWAPGVNVTSAFKDGPNSKATFSGTSMAAPHVCGLKLYLDSLCGKKRKPVEACAYMQEKGIDFKYFTPGFTDPVGASGLPVPGLGLGFMCTISDFVQTSSLALGKAKSVFNGGACACEGW